MAAQGLHAPLVVSLSTAPLACTSTRRNASSVSSAHFASVVPSGRSVHHTKLTFGANPFFAGGILVDLLKCAVHPSRDLRPYTASGGGVVRAAALSFFPFLRQKGADREKVKFELLAEISPLSRGANATEEDCERIDEICQQLEKLNPTKDPLKSPLLSGKWKLLYTTSDSVLLKSRPAIFRPNGPIYQAINTDTLRAQNLETWPFFNQVTANLEPVSGSKVIVKFDFFKIAGLISIKAPGRARGELDITYLDDELRISRGDRGNLFVLVMDDPDYVVPVQPDNL